MSEARRSILSRLRAAPSRPEGAQKVERPPWPEPMGWDAAARLERFTACLESVNGEVHRTTRKDWLPLLLELIAARRIGTLACGASPELPRIMARAWATSAHAPQVIPYERPVEQWKDRLFAVDAALTTSLAGIAATGSLVLWPDEEEPRLLSLVPPVHFALLDVDHLYESFSELIAAEAWSSGMPTNALLISGPSKTADIEQTLAYGVHGPRELIVLALEG